MFAYVVRRLMMAVPVLWGVTLLVFFLLTELPAVGPVLAPLVPRSAAPLVGHYLPLVHSTLTRLVRGQATVAIVMAVTDKVADPGVFTESPPASPILNSA